MKVIDSSAFVDLTLGEISIEQLGLGPLAAPHLVDAEFLHAIRGLVLGGKIGQEQAGRMVRRFEQLAITRFPAHGLNWRIWELRDNLTAYDATYVALAESLDTTFVTTDGRAARAPGVRCPVEVV